MRWRPWIRDRLRFRKPPADQSAPPAVPLPVPVVVYTRVGCHLCDIALEILKRQQRQFNLQIKEVDIDRDPKLRAQFDQCVPVIEIAGRIRFRGMMNEALLIRQLRAERKG